MLLPNVVAYGEALPEGWSSFPHCLARTFLVAGLRERGAFEGVDGLPADVARAIDRAGKDGEWHPEVLHVACLLALRDALFPGADGEPKFLSWLEQLNRELMGPPDQGGAFSATTPEDLVMRFGAVWSELHRGPTYTVDLVDTGVAEIVLTYPRQLFVAMTIESHRRAFAAGLAKAGAVLPIVTAVVEDEGPLAHARFRAVWQRD